MRAPTLWGFMFFMAVVPGCSILPERPPTPAIHDFGQAIQTAGLPQNGAAMVAVSAPEWLMDDQIHYRLAYDDPTRVRFYNLDRWLASPPSLLAQYLSSGMTGGIRMHVRLLDFEQIFDTPNTAHVLMRFRATIRPPGDTSESHERRFQLSRACTTPDARGAVTAFALMVGDAEGQLRAWHAGQPRAYAPGDP